MVHRPILVLALAGLLVGCGPRRIASTDQVLASVGPVPSGELNIAEDRRAVVDSARALMRADSNVALVSVDSTGQPRAHGESVRGSARCQRSKSVANRVDHDAPEARKVDQIRRHPLVTLYFNDDAKVN